MNFQQIIRDNWDAWMAAPLPSIFALLLSFAAALFLMRMRYQGKIDTLEERVKHRDDQIKFKDDTIQSLNAKPKRTRARTRDGSASVEETAQEIQAQLTAPNSDAALHLQNEKIIKAITKIMYKFVFEPLTEKSKLLTFNTDGTIGEGRNANEDTWRTVNGSLEIYNKAKQVYSRFTLLDDGVSLHHTNQSDTLSNRGQYMIPFTYPWNSQTSRD